MTNQRTLSLFDLILMNVVAVASLRWIASASSNGPSSLGLWVLAVLLFFIPQGFAVTRLSRLFPEDTGGLYRWTQRSFGVFHGFLCGWCYWVNNLLYFPALLMYVSANIVFAADGAHPEWKLGANPSLVFAMTIGTLWLIALCTLMGMRTGKWVQNVGSLGNWIPGVAVAVMGAVAYSMYGSATPIRWGTVVPSFSDYSQLSFFAQMCFALAGLELISFLSGEVAGSHRTITRALVISAFGIAGIYWIGTLGVLVSVPKESINAINGLVLPMAEMGKRWGMDWIGITAAVLIALGGIGTTMAWFAGASRVPYMVGVDRYLPTSFGKLHPKLGTPYIAIFVQTAIATLFTILATAGSSTGLVAVYQTLCDMCLILYFIPYCYLFLSLMRLGKRRRDLAAGIVGLMTTVVAIVTTVLPNLDAIPWMTLAKTVGGTVTMVIVGAWFFQRGERSKREGLAAPTLA